ncbi:hypothetical protein [Roseibium album]|uniref:hypothetical protein n=1 Tax=Roseibium album TaxID=311410 RepID=UPI00329A55C5
MTFFSNSNRDGSSGEGRFAQASRDFFSRVARLIAAIPGPSTKRSSRIEQDRLFLPLLTVSATLCVVLIAYGGGAFGRTAIWLVALVPFSLLVWRSYQEKRQFSKLLVLEVGVLDTFAEAARSKREALELSSGSITREDIFNLTPRSERTETEFAKSFIEEIASGKLYLLSAPVDSVLQPYRSQIESRINGILQYSTLCTRLGILGTFFGLVMSLQQLSDLFSVDSVSNLLGTTAVDPEKEIAAGNQLQLQFVGTLSDLSFAFVTSVYGLVGAILVTWFSASVRRQAAQFYKSFSEAYSFAREMVRHLTLADPGVHASLTEVGRQLEAVQDKLFDHGSRVSEALNKQSLENKKQIDRLREAANGMNDAQKDWSSAFEGLQIASRDLKENSVGAISKLNEALGSVVDTVSASVRDMSSGQQELREASSEIRTSFKEADDNWKERVDSLLSDMRKDREGQAEFHTKLSDYEANIVAAIGTMNTRLDTATSHIGAFSNQVGAVQTSVHELKSTVESFERNVARIGKSVRGSGWFTRLFRLLAVTVLLVVLLLGFQISILDDPLALKEPMTELLRSLSNSAP